MIKLQDVKDYLGIEFDDEAIDRRLNNLIKVADGYLKGSLGEHYLKDDYMVKELALLVISDLYDNHDFSEKVSGNIRKLINDFSMQVKLEMKRKGLS